MKKQKEKEKEMERGNMIDLREDSEVEEEESMKEGIEESQGEKDRSLRLKMMKTTINQGLKIKIKARKGKEKILILMKTVSQLFDLLSHVPSLGINHLG